MKNQIKNFLANEDGFLGALAGAAVGGLFGGGSGAVLAKGLGTAIGKGFDERRAQGKANAYAAGALQRTVNQARAAGIHPLEAIRSGHANQGQILPRIGTSAAFGNQFDQIDSILSGREAQKDRLRESQIELNRVEADERRRSAERIKTVGGKFPGTGKTNGNTSTGVASNIVLPTEHGGEAVMPLDETGRGLKSDATDPSHTDYNPTAAPRVRIFGQDFRGSGNISSGQTFEDGVGEGPLQWLMSPLIAADMVGAELGRASNAQRIEREIQESVHPKKPINSKGNYGPRQRY